MMRYVVLFVAFLLFISVAFVLLLSVLVLLTMACAVGIPLYLMSKRWMRRQGIAKPAVSPMDRLRNLYVEGKIDLFEFEQRIAQLIHVER